MLGETKFTSKLIYKYIIFIMVSFCGLIISFLLYGSFEEIKDMIIRMIISIPINTMLTTFFLDSLFYEKERRKINMLVDIFYSEVGNDILKVISEGDKCKDRIKYLSEIQINWSVCEYQKLFDDFYTFKNCLDIDKIDLKLLRKLLEDATPISIYLLTSTNLKEREEFEEIVLAILHLKKELDNKNIVNNEGIYIEKEIIKVYELLAGRWLNYIYHLNKFKPNLFKEALSNSPFARGK